MKTTNLDTKMTREQELSNFINHPYSNKASEGYKKAVQELHMIRSYTNQSEALTDSYKEEDK